MYCELCPRGCDLALPFCHARREERRDNVPLTTEGALLSAACYDPVEKKNLYHFYPGSSLFSIGGWGCNHSCFFCQNHRISQVERVGNSRLMSPEDIATYAISRKDCAGVAYCYNEPFLNPEMMYKIATLVNSVGLMNVAATNGCFNLTHEIKKAVKEMDALVISLKGGTDASYREVSENPFASIDIVEKFIDFAKSKESHVEITYPLIPNINDTEEDILRVVQIAKTFDTPLHFLGYVPHNRNRQPSASLEDLTRAYEMAKAERVRYVYFENVQETEHHSTYCPSCGEPLLKRDDVELLEDHLKRETGVVCPGCGVNLSEDFYVK